MTRWQAPFGRPGTRSAISLSALSLGLVAGCDDAPVTTPATSGEMTVDVTVDPDMTDFEVRSDMAESPGGPIGGPFVIRGSNLAYDESTGALVVDLVIVNDGTRTLSEPIALVFTDFIPDGVTVLDPDTDETGAGAKIFFGFANDDAMWTPGEESFPRTVSFAVDPGVSIAFGARIEAGMPQGGGRIGGIVWHDANENGERDTGEGGISDVRIVISAGFGPKFSTHTNDEGRYVFEGLGAGTYTVIKAPRDDLEPTTPSSLTVLLSEVEGEVSDFLDADFGCVRRANLPELEVGDYVHATGEYATEPDRIIARGLEVRHGDDDPWDDDDDPWDGDDGGEGRDGSWPRGEIRGPVTDIDRTERMLQIMGTWFRVGEGAPDDTTETPGDDGSSEGVAGRALGENDCAGWDLDLQEIEVGDRVRARVALTDAASPSEPHVVLHMKCWLGEREKVRGPIEAIEEGPDDRLHLVVLRTLVVVTPETEIDDD